ncbi:MAG TPA: hypothetical protein VMV47_04925 [Bacteroidales bacterium]|nr:hypothetical protein [Bacteroidales bacterium]
MGKDFVLNQIVNTSSFKDQESLEAHFDKVAQLILNRTILRIDKNTCRFTEIEFYFYDEAYHKDPFIHKHDLQKLPGQWYFHGSGLDLTFGDLINYGGVLIRGIKKTGPVGDIYIDGPLNVVTEIFKSFGNMAIKEHLFHIYETNDIEQYPIVKSTRVGLKPNESSNFHELFYRYISFPFEPSHKYAEKIKVASALLKTEKQFDKSKQLTVSDINSLYGWRILKA